MPKNSYGLSASEMLDELHNAKVSLRVYTTARYYLDIEKAEDGVKFSISLSNEEFLPLVREAYDKWHQFLDGQLGKHLGMPMIEHHIETPPHAPLSGNTPTTVIGDELSQEEANELSNRDKATERGLTTEELIAEYKNKQKLDDEIPF